MAKTSKEVEAETQSVGSVKRELSEGVIRSGFLSDI